MAVNETVAQHVFFWFLALGFAWSIYAGQQKTLVLPDDPGLWICVNTDVGQTCQTQDQVKAWMLENGVRELQ